MLVGAAVAFAVGPQVAHADPSRDPLELRSRTETGELPLAYWSPRFEGELTWARMVLRDDVPLQRMSSGPSFSMGDLLDVEQDVFALRARALTSLVSAVGPLVSKGFSMFEVVRNGKVRQRHRLRAFWRSGGLMLVWRIDL